MHLGGCGAVSRISDMFPVTHAYGRNSPAHPSFVQYPAGHAGCAGCEKPHNRDTTSRTCGDLKFVFDRITAWSSVWDTSYAVRMCCRGWSICKAQSVDMNFFDEVTKWPSLLPQGVSLPPTFGTVIRKMHCLSIIYTIPFKNTCIGFSSALLVRITIT